MTATTDRADERAAVRSRRARTLGRLRTPGFLAWLTVTLSVLAGNAVYLLRLRSNNPLMYHSGLGSPVRGVVHADFGYGHWPYTIDANDGWTAQALGRLGAEQWAHGHVPLWNGLEGLGQPLAGEMQSAAFFLPFVLLQLLPNGIFLMHLALEFVAGFSTLLFLRSLRLSWTAAAAGGSLFALNGAFSVMTNAPFNPIAFLPTALWGVELIAAAVREGRRPRAGVWVSAFSVAFMLYAGFPETAFLEALFVAVWAVVRLVDLRAARARFAGWTVAAAVIGVLMSGPILLAFAHFMSFGYAAYHSGEAGPTAYLGYKATAFAAPYLTGPFNLNPVFGGVAGYVTLPTLLLAVIGLLGRRPRTLKVLTGGVLAALILNMYGVSAVHAVIDVVPGMKSILVYKYGWAIVEFVMILWAAYGLDDIVRGVARRWAVLLGAAVTVGYLAVAWGLPHSRGWLSHQKWTTIMLCWLVAGAVVIVACALLSGRTTRLRAALMAVVALVVVADGVGMYVVPQLSASPRRAVDMAPVEFLQHNLGTARFYTLGPIQPNYGSYWGLAQLNVNDLPVPQKLADHIEDDLRPEPGTPGSRGTARAYMPYELTPLSFTPYQQRELLRGYAAKQQYFRQAAVKFLVTSPGVVTPAQATRLNLTRVLRSPKTDIWRDARAEQFYTAPGCTTQSVTFDAVTVRCAENSVLRRRMLSTPGWTATVNGGSQPVVDGSRQLYQSVPVPAGTSRIEFSYLPTHFRPVVAVALALVVVMLLDTGWFLVRRRRSSARSSRDATAATGAAASLRK